MHRFEPDARPRARGRPARARHGRARRALRAARERARRRRHRRLRRRPARPRPHRASAAGAGPLRRPRRLGEGRRAISARSACASASSTAACRACLFGHSMGSFIALECLTRFGDAYRAAVLSGSSGSAGPRGLGVPRARHRRAPAARRARPERAAAARRVRPVQRALRARGDALRLALARSGGGREVRRRSAVRLRASRRASLAELARRAAGGSTRRDHLARIPHALPLLAIAGERDPVGGRAGVDEARRRAARRRARRGSTRASTRTRATSS